MRVCGATFAGTEHDWQIVSRPANTPHGDLAPVAPVPALCHPCVLIGTQGWFFFPPAACNHLPVCGGGVYFYLSVVIAGEYTRMHLQAPITRYEEPMQRARRQVRAAYRGEAYRGERAAEWNSPSEPEKAPQGLWSGEPPNGIRRLNLKRPLRAYGPVPEGT